MAPDDDDDDDEEETCRNVGLPKLPTPHCQYRPVDHTSITVITLSINLYYATRQHYITVRG